MKSPVFLGVLFLLISFNFFSQVAAEISPDLSGIHEITGEIKVITGDTVWISDEGIIRKYSFAAGIKIICNGVMGTWKSLTPITSEALFEAVISIDKTNHVIMIDGFYQGEECVIGGWFFYGGQLNLQLQPVAKAGICCKIVNKSARVPEEGWLNVGQLVFAVYNRKGEIRGVYLPN